MSLALRFWGNPRRIPPRIARWIALAVVIESTVIVGAGRSGWPHATVTALLVATALLASLACFTTARSTPVPAAWRALGACAGAWAAVEAVQAWFEFFAHRTEPIPSLADVAFMGAAVGALTAAVSFSGRPRSPARLWLDAAIAAGALGFVAWSAVVAHASRIEFASTAQRITTFGHPLIDAVVVGVLAVLALSRHAPTTGVALACTGLAVLAAGDAASWRLDPLGPAPAILDAVRITGYLLLASAARVIGPRDVSQRTPSSLRFSAGPSAVTVLMAVGVAAVNQARGIGLDASLFWIALGVIVAAIARSVVSASDNSARARGFEAKVAERTAELEDALARADEARKTEDAFVATVSHELRTPLTTMLGATITMLRPEIPMCEDARVLAGIAHRGAERMSSLVEEMLIASGIGGADRPTPGISFDAGARLLTVLNAHHASAHRTHTSIDSSLPAEGDPERFEIAISQLLENAVKFAPHGPIDVSARNTARGVEIRVRDYGPGIPADARERIFDRFYQADAGITRSCGGSGLGLFIARRLVEAMGGSLVLESVAPGAAFCLSLPASGRRRLSLKPPAWHEPSGVNSAI
ncbi:MAG: HAMP domain-containing sensor histidine kinase [Actinomycetota bacterium]